MRKIVTAFYVSVSAVSLALSVNAAMAQTSSGGIEEIVVTSER